MKEHYIAQVNGVVANEVAYYGPVTFNFVIQPNDAHEASTIKDAIPVRSDVRMLAWGGISLAPIVASIGTKGWPEMAAVYLAMGMACALYAYWQKLMDAASSVRLHQNNVRN